MQDIDKKKIEAAQAKIKEKSEDLFHVSIQLGVIVFGRFRSATWGRYEDGLCDAIDAAGTAALFRGIPLDVWRTACGLVS